MRILITGDFQAEWQNLDLCQRAWEEVLDIAESRKLTAIAVTGDLKRVYNPVDVRVVKWWQKAIAEAKKRLLDVIIVLGNHDRVGQYSEAENWLPILKRAGAFCASKPREFYVRGGQLLALPFCTDKEEQRRRAQELAKLVVTDEAVLLFHEDIRGSKYNKFGERSEAVVGVDDLCASAYKYCVGGHIHLHQKIGENVYYAGSPFAQDWGEANQRKGYVVITGGVLEFVPSRIPGWFDPTWPGFWEPKSWEGTRVRVHLTVDSAAEYATGIERVRAEAEAKYKGAEVSVNAVIRRAGNDVSTDGISIDSSDGDKIKQYVERTCPEHINQRRVIEYLVGKLEEVGGVTRTGTGLKILGARARNFLSFKELTVDFRVKGITLVQGKNKDRGGKSNGSGKTSLLQTIPVPLFGTTFKGQKHDRWARRNAEGAVTVQLELKDGRGRAVRVVRGRRPSRLRLWVNGTEETTGMNPALREATQASIEQVTGFTWETLANAVYMDREVARAFIAGTKRERAGVLSRFQNLERFERALKAVRKDKAKGEEEARDLEEQIAVTVERVSGCRRRLSVLVEESAERVSTAWAEVESRERVYKRLERKLTPIIKRCEESAKRLEARWEEANKISIKAETAHNKRRGELASGREELKRLEEAREWKLCPHCRQSVNKLILGNMVKKQMQRLEKLESAVKAAEEFKKECEYGASLLEADYEERMRRKGKYTDKVNAAKFAYDVIHEQYLELQRREHNESSAKRDAKKELLEAVALRKELEGKAVRGRSDKEFYQYAERAMGRDGIPAFLNALLCPKLNAAAEFYADEFSDGEIKVSFEVEDGELVPRVLNATGGETIDDQSDGEGAVAGLIGSFALREAAPKCNLLILDEPGAGLDPMAARQFAIALRRLTKRFGAIWLTTHNPAIQEELADQRIITVVKHRGVSRLIE